MKLALINLLSEKIRDATLLVLRLSGKIQEKKGKEAEG